MVIMSGGGEVEGCNKWHAMVLYRYIEHTPAMDGILNIFSARSTRDRGTSQNMWQGNLCVSQPLFVSGIKYLKM